MSRFAKLFDTPSGQFLVTLDGEDDDGMWPMVFRGEHDRCIPEVSNLYPSLEERQGHFDGIDQAMAEESAATMAQMVDNFFKPGEAS